MKKILSVVLVAVILLSAIPLFSATAGAATSYVTIAKTKTITCVPKSTGKKVTFTYKLPKINLTSTDAKKANKEIATLFDQACSEAEFLVQMKALNKLMLKHYVYQNGSILSLLIEHHPIAGTEVVYSVYNFNVKTGKRLTDEQIAKGVGSSLAKATAHAKSIKFAEGSFHENKLYYKGSKTLMGIVVWETGYGECEKLVKMPMNNRYAAPKLKSIKNTEKGPRFVFAQAKGAEMYRVFRKSGSSSWKKLGDVVNTRDYIIDKTAKKGTTYTYTVRCIQKNGKTYESGFNKTGLKIKCK